MADIKKDEIKGQVRSYKSNPGATSELINKKISKFYEHAKE